MTDADAQLIALRHYRTLWLGQTWDQTKAAWDAEYTAVSTGAFKPLQTISQAFEGTSSTARQNFEQAARVAALQAYRAEKDADYAAEVFAPQPGGTSGPTATVFIFGPAAFPH